MSRDPTNPRATAPPKPAKIDTLNLTSPSGEGDSSQEDDAPTRVFTKKATFSQDTTLPMIRATTREREKENSERRLPSYYVRDFGDKISPGYDEIRRLAGIRTNSTLTAAAGQSAKAEPDVPEVTSMDIMHNWTQEVHNEEFIATINILKKGHNRSTGSAESGQEGRIVWIHVEDQLPSLERLERFFQNHLARRVEQFVSETTLSLLNRVKTTRERKLVSGTLGRFLVPGVVRYSARSSETGNEDHPCLFLAYPYLALGRFARVPPGDQVSLKTSNGSMIGRIRRENKADKDEHSSKKRNALPQTNGYKTSDTEAQNTSGAQRKTSEMRNKLHGFDEHSPGSPEKCYHPPRTLLQSRYRLESTKKRDKNQSVLTLTPKELRECISRPSRSVAASTVTQGESNNAAKPTDGDSHSLSLMAWLRWRKSKQKREKLYIPQLWCLSLAGDVMLTCGPIKVDDLCSSVLIRRDFNPGGSKLRHSIVRFVLEHDSGKSDIFIYPAERCEWFFGLINKQRKVENTLVKQRTTLPAVVKNPSDGLRYTLVYRKTPEDHGRMVDCFNWLMIQSEHMEPHLDLYMEIQKRPPIVVHGTSVDQPPSHLLPTRRSNSQKSLSHMRSVSDTASTATPTSPRFLVVARPEPQRGSSGSSSARSASPMSISATDWPESHNSFFEWPFLEEVALKIKNNRQRTCDERVGAWLAKTLNVVYRAQGQHMHVSLKPENKSVPFDQIATFKPAIEGKDLHDVDTKFFSPNAADTIRDVIRDKHKRIGTEAQNVFSKTKQMLKLFVPKHWVCPNVGLDDETSKTIRVYWGLVDRILDGIVEGLLEDSDLQLLSQKLDLFLGLAKRTHRGVWKLDGNKRDYRSVTTVESAVIYMPLANAFEHVCEFLFNVVSFMFTSKTTPNLKQGAFEQATSRSTSHILKDFERAQRFLIQGGDESRYQQNLGPVVTPEGITILLLRRLSRGVHRDGTIDLIELYERVVERLAAKVETGASRFLLLEINRVAEEIEIVLETFLQQRSFLDTYKDYLNPQVIENASNKRISRFEYEQHGIERTAKDLDECIKDCRELREHVQRLADQNLQLVEGGQDDINKKLMLFTIFTIIFLPPSFVTSFFGMNLKGIADTEETTAHFWRIAAPLTGGLLIMSLVILYQSWLYGIWCRLRARFSSDDVDDD